MSFIKGAYKQRMPFENVYEVFEWNFVETSQIHIPFLLILIKFCPFVFSFDIPAIKNLIKLASYTQTSSLRSST